MIAEAYTKDGIVAVVHFRQNGQVYGHTQRTDEDYIPWGYLFRMDEDAFTESVRGSESYDVRRLRFNSTLVRLRLRFKTSGRLTLKRFQFHSGSIKTKK